MSRLSLMSGAVAALCALAAYGPAAAQSYATFSVRDGTSTNPYAINAGGVVTGAYCGTDWCDGFVRTAGGKITSFEGPTLTTVPLGINRKGAIAGFYVDDSGAGHGFLRNPGGKFISFDPPGSTNTLALAINNSGVITGYYNTHGFLRAADGTITTFDPSGSTGTVPTAINAKGDVAGYYTYQGHEHGFLRTADGTITSFDVDGAQYTQALGINSKDAIVGSGSGTIGFLRTPGGKISTFGQGLPLTQASGINDKGQIAGFYSLSQPPPYGHGYVGSPKSGFTNFDVPNGTQAEAFGINDSGVIAGSYYDSNYNQDGFVRTP